MKENREHKGFDRDEYLRYRSGEMNQAERNHFERKLQADPFLADAVDGMSELSANELEQDLANLSLSIGKRTRKRSTLIYRIAASVVILLGISVIFLVRDLRQPDIKIAENTVREARKMPEPSVMHDKSESLSRAELKDIPEERRDIELAERLEQPAVPAVDDEGAVAAGKIVTVDTVKLMDIREEGIRLESVMAEELEEPLKVTGVPVSEKAAARQKKARAADMYVMDDLSAIEIQNAPPRPSVGELEYQEYIDKNLHFPYGFDMVSREMVKLKFLVQTDGQIRDIKVLNKVDKAFSDEAIRLLMEGPQWLPALKDGVRLEQEVSYKIEFRRD